MKSKKPQQNKKKTGPVIALIVIVAIIIGGVFYYNEQQKNSEENNLWKNISGPFAINKFQYKIGENVFMIVSNLKPIDSGQIIVVDPKGETFAAIPFNGTLKTSFHYYFKPNTQNYAGVNLCNPSDLVGKWGVIFQGVPYKSIKFEIINEWIKGAEAEIQPIPKDLCK